MMLECSSGRQLNRAVVLRFDHRNYHVVFKSLKMYFTYSVHTDIPNFTLTRTLSGPGEWAGAKNTNVLVSALYDVTRAGTPSTVTTTMFSSTVGKFCPVIVTKPPVRNEEPCIYKAHKHQPCNELLNHSN